MYPGDFVALLWEFRTHRFVSCGVERNRWGDRNRDSVGLSPHGTIWFATFARKGYATYNADDGSYQDSMIIPANSIPKYNQVKKKYDFRGKPYVFDPETHRFFGIERGWKDCFIELARGRFFRPSDKLSRFISMDSWQVVPNPWGL